LHTTQILCPVSKLLVHVPKSYTSNFINLSCTLVPELSNTRDFVDRVEHALFLPSFWYEILVPVMWTENLGHVP